MYQPHYNGYTGEKVNMKTGESFAESLKEISQEEKADRLIKAALQEGLPLALWRMPAQKEQHLLIDLSGEASPVHPKVETLPSGFLFTPYAADLTAPEAAAQKQSLLLNADLYFTTANNDQPRLAHDLSSAQKELAKKINAPSEAESDDSGDALNFFINSSAGGGSASKEDYCRLVERAVKEIEADHLQKLVCGRSKRLPLPEKFQPIRFFRLLCEAYPHAFVSFVSIPDVGSWIGATPEVLISINADKVFKTMALAGTQPKSAALKPADAAWRQKEIEEQALVSRYIINCFKKIRLREFDEIGPRTVVAGNLMHLRSDFKVENWIEEFPRLGSQMLGLLHPTSAVCGMPRSLARDFLAAHEELDRQFFAGFLGPVNLQKETSLFVNLRCMQLLEKEAVLYAGAGITADSDPEREWLETEEKIKTLSALLEDNSLYS